MRAEEFCSRRSQKVGVPTVNSISNDKHTETEQEKAKVIQVKDEGSEML